MSRILAAAGVLLISLAVPQNAHATAFEEFVAALSRGDIVFMQGVVSRNRDEMARNFFLLLREAASILDGSAHDPQERNRAGMFVLAAAHIAKTFDQVDQGRDLLYQQIRNSPLLTPAVQSFVDSDAALSRFLLQRAAELAVSEPGGETSLARDLRSIYDAATEPPEARLRRMLDEAEARARQELEAALAEQRRQRELQELSDRIERLRRARNVDGLLGIATDGSLPVELRRRAVAALGETGTPRAAVGLGPLLHDAGLQDDVIKALVALGGEDAAAALAARLDEEPIAGKAFAALLEIGEPHAVPPLVGKLGNPGARDRAISALSAIWGSRARERWLQLVRQERQLERRRFLATTALLAAGDAAAVGPLAGFLGDGPLETALLRKLGELGGAASIEILIRQLDHSGVAAAAGEALGRIGAPAFPALLRRSEQPGPGRRVAAEALAAAGYRPRSLEEEASLLLARGERFGLVRLGPFALPVLTAATRRLDAETATTAWSVLALELGLVLAALALLRLFLRRRWIWPGAEMELTPGGRARLPRGLWTARRWPVETGTILQTAWARDSFGRRHRIKMEVLASLGAASRGEPPGTAFDVLIAAGASVAPGTYLAVAPTGSVKIRVKPG